jgi:hypothetical protein
MGVGDLSDLDSRLLSRGSFNQDDTGLTGNVRRSFINAALKQISNERDWPWLFTTATIATVAGTAAYAHPTGYVRTDSIFEPSTGDGLDERQIEELDRITARDRPTFWCSYGTTTVLGPVPDGVYTLTHRYVRAEPLLTDDDDAPLIPNAFDEGTVEWACYLAHTFARQYDKAQEASARYNAWLKATYDNVRRGRRPLRVQVRPGAVW